MHWTFPCTASHHPVGTSALLMCQQSGNSLQCDLLLVSPFHLHCGKKTSSPPCLEYLHLCSCWAKDPILSGCAQATRNAGLQELPVLQSQLKWSSDTELQKLKKHHPKHDQTWQHLESCLSWGLSEPRSNAWKWTRPIKLIGKSVQLIFSHWGIQMLCHGHEE